MLSSELGITVSELLDGEKAERIEKSADEAIIQIIDYSAKAKRKQVFSKRDVDFITSIIVILIVTLLIIGGFLNAQTVPMVVFGLVVLLVVFRLFFGRCPGCGKLLPFWGVSKSCPFCGIRLK